MCMLVRFVPFIIPLYRGITLSSEYKIEQAHFTDSLSFHNPEVHSANILNLSSAWNSQKDGSNLGVNALI